MVNGAIKSINVSIEEPDSAYWNAHFPGGLGCSAFSSPAFQKILVKLEQESADKTNWEQRFLRIHWEGGQLTIPVLAKRARFGRWMVVTRPIGYSITPIEKASFSSDELEVFLKAICSPRFAYAHYLFSPWSLTADNLLQSQTRWHGALSISTVNTYIITRKGSVEEYLKNNISSTLRNSVRVNTREGLKAHVTIDDDEIRRYYQLYLRVYRERGWEGTPFTGEFIEGAAQTLGAGGELVLLTHEKEIVGGGVLLYDHDAVHIFQSVMNRDVRGIFPHVGLHTYALEQAKQRNLSYVNLGGVNAGNTGLVRFKKSWGAAETPFTAFDWRSTPKHIVRRLFK